VEKSRSENRMKDASMDALRSELSSMQSQVATLAGTYEENRHLRAQLNLAGEKQRVNDSETVRLSDTITAVQTRHSHAERELLDKVSQLTVSGNSTLDKSNALQAQVYQLQAQVDQHQQQHATTRGLLGSAEKQLAALEQSLREEQLACATAVASADAARSQLEQEKLLTQAQTRRLEDARGLESELRKQLAEAQGDCERERGEGARLHSMLQAEVATAAGKEQQLQAAERAQAVYHQRVEAQAGELGRVVADRADLQVTH
jgi:chromosome segregation ATPase